MLTDRLPALERLTDDLTSAMHAAEQPASRTSHRRARRASLLALLALGVAVPAAIAVHLTTRTEIDLPFPGRTPQQAFAVGRGQAHGLFWTLAVTRCELRGVVTLIPATLIETRPGSGGGGYSMCPRGLSGNPPRPQPLLDPTFSSSGGLSVLWGIVPARVASVELHLARYVARPAGTPARPRATQRVRVPTRPLDPAGVQAGKLPPGYRLFVITRSGNSVAYTRAIARDTDGDVIRNCTRRQCDSLARRGR